MLINQGTVHSELPGQITFGANGVTVINDGIIMGTDGGSISITGNWTNNSSITIQDGGTLSLAGTYNNLGTITANNSTVVLGSQFTIDQLGTFNRSGGTVRLTGRLDNPTTITLNASTGSWQILQGGRIVGGVVETLDGTSFSASGCCINNARFDGVTMNGTLSVSSSTVFVIANSMTLNGSITMFGGSGSAASAINFDTSTPQTLDGTGFMRIASNGTVRGQLRTADRYRGCESCRFAYREPGRFLRTGNRQCVYDCKRSVANRDFRPDQRARHRQRQAI